MMGPFVSESMLQALRIVQEKLVKESGKLRFLKLERVKDYLLIVEEFVVNQEHLNPHKKKTEEDDRFYDALSRGSIDDHIMYVLKHSSLDGWRVHFRIS